MATANHVEGTERNDNFEIELNSVIEKLDGLTWELKELKERIDGEELSTSTVKSMIEPYIQQINNELKSIDIPIELKMLSYSNQQLNPIQEGSEISSLQSVTHQGLIETDENRHRLLQQQLGILLHAHICLKQGPDCKVPMCSTMKDVLKHLTVCETKENCYYVHCSSSRRIILHYKQCLDPVCKLCMPLKSCGNIRQGIGQYLSTAPIQQDIAGLNSLQFPDQSSFTGPPPRDNISNSARFLLSSASLPPANSALTTSIAGDMNQSQSTSLQTQIPLSAAMVMQSWHQEVKQDLRQHLVKKLVFAAYSSVNIQDSSENDNRMNFLFTQATGMEEMMFQQASSRFPDQSSFTGPPPRDNISNSARFLLSSASLPPANSALTTSIAGDMNQSQSTSLQTQIPLSAAMVMQSWHQEVKQDLRQHLVKKLVFAAYSSVNIQDSSENDNRMNFLFTQATGMEEMMFQQASSREEYYQMIARKIFEIQKEMDTGQKQGNF